MQSDFYFLAVCFIAQIIFLSAISNSHLAMLCLLQHSAGAKFCWLHELCVAMIRFWVCLCVLREYIGLLTCVLCVLLFDLIFVG